jgi:flagellar biosynthesis/type III secretory pathway M-ring protein FliF/YscJ
MVDKWINVIRYAALAVLFLLVYMLVLRPIRRQIVTTFRALPNQLAAAKGAEAALNEASPQGSAGKEEGLPGSVASFPPQLGEAMGEVKQAVQLKKNLLDKVKKEPATVSRLVQNWVRQEVKL